MAVKDGIYFRFTVQLSAHSLSCSLSLPDPIAESPPNRKSLSVFLPFGWTFDNPNNLGSQVPTNRKSKRRCADMKQTSYELLALLDRNLRESVNLFKQLAECPGQRSDVLTPLS